MLTIFKHITSALNGITNGSILGRIGVGIGAFLTGMYAPIAGILCTCFASTIVDLYYGLKVARKNNKKIESGKTWKGTLKKIRDEFIIISLARGLEWSVLDESGVFFLTGGAAVIITLTEIWSIIENLNTLDPKGPWRVLGKFLKKKGEDYVGIELDTQDDDTMDIKSLLVGEQPS